LGRSAVRDGRRCSSLGVLAIAVLMLVGLSLWVVAAEAQTFTTSTWTISNPVTTANQPQFPAGLAGTSTQPISPVLCPVTDVGGTGQPGYLCPYVQNSTSDVGYVSATNTGSGYSQSGITTGVPSPIDYYAPFPGCYSGNFDGNGQYSTVCVAVSGPYTYINGGTHVAVNAINYLSWYHATTFQQVTNETTMPFPGTTVASQNTSIDGCMVVDVNGDGRDDLACSVIYSPTSGDNDDSSFPEVAAYIYISTPTGFVESPLVLGSTAPDSAYLSNCLPGDFNGDGLTDFACGGGSTWKMFYSVGIGTVPHFVEVDGPGPAGFTPGWKATYPQNISDECLTGDFNGDGRTDIACYRSGGQWSVGLATGDNATIFNVQTWTSGPSPLTTSPHTAGGDCWGTALDGSAIGGIFCYTGANGQWNYGKRSGSGTQFTVTTVATGYTPPPDDPPTVVSYPGGKKIYISGIAVTTWCALRDFNGDTLPDVACAPNQTGIVSMLLSVRPS
jgi:hypothetical protein